jgi:hypothetical protein
MPAPSLTGSAGIRCPRMRGDRPRKSTRLSRTSDASKAEGHDRGRGLNEAELEEILSQLVVASAAAQAPLVRRSIVVEYAAAPHRQPANLPRGKLAIYAFFHHGRCLKCGKAGPNSQARYTSQHYNPNSAPSTLANTLLVRCAEIGVSGLQRSTVGDWVRSNTSRVNLLFPSVVGSTSLAFYEAFLHLYWKQIFEGREWVWRR